jgi:hypothetical protein
MKSRKIQAIVIIVVSVTVLASMGLAAQDK